MSVQQLYGNHLADNCGFAGNSASYSPEDSPVKKQTMIQIKYKLTTY
jgi:hypothetical protein